LKRLSSFASMLAAHVRGCLGSLAVNRHSIGARLLIGVLLFSGSVTLIMTVIELYIDYRRNVSALELRLNQISGSYLDSLAEGLWALNEKQLELQLDGILRLPDIRAAEVHEGGPTGNPLIVKLSRNSESPIIARDYPLHYTVQGEDKLIGTLHVEATLSNIYRRLESSALTTLGNQAAQTFLISLFVLYIFHSLVTRHLSAIAADVGSYRINDSPLELALRRRSPRQEDELQQVVTAFNVLSHKLHNSYRDLRDANEKLTQDVMARRQAEAVVREREARIRRLVDANIIGIFIWDMDGHILEANDAFLQMVGYNRDDLVGGRFRWTDLLPPEQPDQHTRAVAEAEGTGAIQPSEREYCRKDGSRVPVLRGAATFEEGGNQGVAFVLDLTERKRAEKALRESEEQWKAVFENNPVMYFLVDAVGTIISVNPFGAEQLGYRADELTGRPVQSIFHEADREAVTRNAARCFEQQGQALSWELRNVRKTGEVIWVRETARATLINNCPVLLIVCENITEGKRAAETLREVQTELAHANRVASLGQLTASIAHEINQPIAGALSSGQAALHWLDKPDLEAARRSIERVIRDASRAGAIISGIRTLVKKVPARTEDFDMNDAIREVVVITRGEATKHGISVQTQLTEGLPPIQGVRVRLQQVILNLIINAIEAMSGVDEGPRELLVKTEKSGEDSVSVAVQDSGPGLDPADLERAFEAFYTTKPEGLGIGLSICRSIVEAHRGRLTVSANVPHGAIFQFAVPSREGTPDES